MVAFLRSKGKDPNPKEDSGASDTAGGPQTVGYESSGSAAMTKESVEIPEEKEENQSALSGNSSPS